MFYKKGRKKMIEITKQDFFNENLEFIEEKIINDVSSRYYKNKSGEYFLLRLNYYVGFLKYFRITYDEYLKETCYFETKTNKEYDSNDSFYRKRFNYGYDD